MEIKWGKYWFQGALLSLQTLFFSSFYLPFFLSLRLNFMLIIFFYLSFFLSVSMLCSFFLPAFSFSFLLVSFSICNLHRLSRSVVLLNCLSPNRNIDQIFSLFSFWPLFSLSFQIGLIIFGQHFFVGKVVVCVSLQFRTFWTQVFLERLKQNIFWVSKRLITQKWTSFTKLPQQQSFSRYQTKIE